jgi:hypothetical protein
MSAPRTPKDWAELIEEHVDERRYEGVKDFLESIYDQAIARDYLSEKQVGALIRIFEEEL